MTGILVFGATSEIATQCCRQWVAQFPESTFVLVGRSNEKLRQTADDLRARGALVESKTIDFDDADQFADVIRYAAATLGSIDIAMLAQGALPDQQSVEKSAVHATHAFLNVCASVIGLMTDLGNHFESQKSGSIVVLSSVAADRGRPSNYVYGAAKSAISTYCEGMRARLFKSGVRVIEVRPGFVDTPMTRNLDSPRVLVSSADRVARAILLGIRRNREVIYAPRYWAAIMLMVRLCPRFIFKRVNL